MLTNALLFSFTKKQNLVTINLIANPPEDMPSNSKAFPIILYYTNDEEEMKSVICEVNKGYSFPVGKVIGVRTNFNPAQYKIGQLIYESSSGTADINTAASFTMATGYSYLKVEIVSR